MVVASTYGKGTVQKTVPFGKPIDFSSGRTEYGAVKLTFQKYYRINGGSVQLKGVTPDVVLPDAYEFYKIREKDNAASLPWDEITKVPYNTWNNADLSSVVKIENEKIAQNKSLNLLRDNLSWLSKNAEMPVNLNMQKYKDMQKQIKATVNQNNSLLKIKEEMAVDVIKVDYDKFYKNPDKVKGERYQAWLKSIKTDMYGRRDSEDDQQSDSSSNCYCIEIIELYQTIVGRWRMISIGMLCTPNPDGKRK